MCVFYACVYDKTGNYIFIDMYICFYSHFKLDNKIYYIMVKFSHVRAFQSKAIRNGLTVGQLGFIVG